MHIKPNLTAFCQGMSYGAVNFLKGESCLLSTGQILADESSIDLIRNCAPVGYISTQVTRHPRLSLWQFFLCLEPICLLAQFRVSVIEAVKQQLPLRTWP